ncbi:hypothetical protein MXB_3416, partial [Myxobolus squamalis]
KIDIDKCNNILNDLGNLEQKIINPIIKSSKSENTSLSSAELFCTPEIDPINIDIANMKLKIEQYQKITGVIISREQGFLRISIPTNIKTIDFACTVTTNNLKM